MNYKIEAFHCLCELSIFEINGIHADYEDFGEKYDNDPGNAEDYGCGDMQFFPKPATSEILNKYNISIDEYDKITLELEAELSFGSCGWCV